MDEKIIRQAISFDENKTRENALSFFDTNINGIDRFAINKFTQNGKYVRGNLLYYKFNGVEIYTESTNIIFVDTKDKTIFIRREENVEAEINPTKPEDKEYILLYTDLGYEEDLEEFPLRWEAVIGRKTAYDNIKANIDVIDVDKSLVLVDTVPLKESLTVRQFMNYIKNGNIIEDDTFDVNDYSGSEYI